MNNELEIRLNDLKNTLKIIESQLENALEGNLVCKKNKGCYQYYIDGKYVKQNSIKTAGLLAQQEYYRKLYPTMIKEIKDIERNLQNGRRDNVGEVYEKMHPGKQILIKPRYITVARKIKAFEQEEYVGLAFDENNNSEIYTNKGERVRSKSEKIIADELYRKMIPYKYEKPVKLNVRGNARTFYPDFTVMNRRTGKIIYVEHLGMMDNESYAINTINKLSIYEKNNLLLGKDVLIFHETGSSPLVTATINKYIEAYME